MSKSLKRDMSERVVDSPLPDREWLKIITIEGSFANVFTVLTGGAFLTGLALMLGANDFEVGLLGAIPFLAQLAQLLSAYLVDRTGHRKSVTLWNSFAARQVWWLMLPVLFWLSRWQLEAFFAVVAISSVAIMIATPAWMSWMADVVPERIRARYFGNRSSALAIVTILATIFGGLILDKFRLGGHEPGGFAVIIAVGCLFAAAALFLLNRVPDKPIAEKNIDFNWTRLMEPLRNRNFNHLLKVFFLWNVSLGISAAFFAAHMITNLKMSFTLISIYSSVGAVVAILFNKPWGVLIDRFGSKPVLFFSALGIGFIPLLWWIPREGHLWILAFETVYSGALWAGFNLAAFTIPIANSPRDGRTTYLAMFSVVTGLAFFAASLAGGILAESMSDIKWSLGPQTIINYHILFALSSLLRLMTAFLLLTFHEPREKPVPMMFQFMGYAVLKRLSIGRQIFPPYGNDKAVKTT